MNKTAKLLLTLLVFTSWAKAGLGFQWNPWLVNLAVAIAAVSLFASHPNKWKDFSVTFAPVLLIGFIIFVSFLNPRFKTLGIKEWSELNAEQYLSEEPDLEKILIITKGFRNIQAVSEKDPQLALTLFFDLKNRYADQFKKTNSPCSNLLDAYEEKITCKHIEALPSVPLRNSTSIHGAIHFLFQITFGIVTFFALRTRKEIRNFVFGIAISGGLLALIGIFQKVHYVPGDEVKEIFGIWNAPEPRYFYSSFTYKNHWCAFSLLSLFPVIALLYYEFKNTDKKLIHSKSVFFLVAVVICLLISIPHSGSRSGVVILLLTMVFFAYSFLLRSKIFVRKFRWPILSSSLALILSVLAFSFYLNRDTSKEMLSNTKTQWSGTANNQLPLRFLLWNDLFNQISHKTLWGYGHNSYPSINPIHQSKEVRDRRSIGLENAHTQYTPLVGRGHSDFLEFISEIGIPLFMLLFTYPIIAIAEIIRNPSPFPKIILLGCIAFLLYFLVDFPSRSPACFLLFASTLGLSLRYARLTSCRNSSKN